MLFEGGAEDKDDHAVARKAFSLFPRKPWNFLFIHKEINKIYGLVVFYSPEGIFLLEQWRAAFGNRHVRQSDI